MLVRGEEGFYPALRSGGEMTTRWLRSANVHRCEGVKVPLTRTSCDRGEEKDSRGPLKVGGDAG